MQKALAFTAAALTHHLFEKDNITSSVDLSNNAAPSVALPFMSADREKLEKPVCCEYIRKKEAMGRSQELPKAEEETRNYVGCLAL